MHTYIHIKESVRDKAMRKGFERKGSDSKKKRRGELDNNSDEEVYMCIYI
jgi:hypothetical protein